MARLVDYWQEFFKDTLTLAVELEDCTTHAISRDSVTIDMPDELQLPGDDTDHPGPIEAWLDDEGQLHYRTERGVRVDRSPRIVPAMVRPPNQPFLTATGVEQGRLVLRLTSVTSPSGVGRRFTPRRRRTTKATGRSSTRGA